jgi:secreted trypsin-like serine protease
VVQVGIVSWGGPGNPTDPFKCANPEYPGVYTRVSEVADWIKSTVCDTTGELCGRSSKAGKVGKAQVSKAGK